MTIFVCMECRDFLRVHRDADAMEGTHAAIAARVLALGGV
jgi:hypothetical protein